MKFHLSKSDRLEFFSVLSPMVSSGIPLVEAINDVGAKAKPNVRTVSRELLARISSGSTLAASMAEMPGAFDPVSVSLISASEESGTLEITLKDLCTALQKEISFEENVRSALTYPIFVFGVFCFVLFVMLLFVIPRVATVFERLRIPVPITTQVLITVSLVLQHYFPYLALTIVLGILGLFFVIRRHPKVISQTLASFPFFSEIALELDIARFSHTLGLLLSSGLPFPMCIDLASQSIQTRTLDRAVNRAKQVVDAGEVFSSSMKTNRWELPSVFIRMIQAGEKSGTLAKAFSEVSDYFEHQSQRTLKSITVLLEPIMIVTIGVFVGGMMLSIVAPIYGLISNIAGGN